MYTFPKIQRLIGSMDSKILIDKHKTILLNRITEYTPVQTDEHSQIERIDALLKSEIIIIM